MSKYKFISNSSTNKAEAKRLILSMKPKDFTDPKNFKDNLTLMTCLKTTFLECKKSFLSKIIFELRGKWANTSNKELLADIAATLVYDKHYVVVHRHEMPERVKQNIDTRIKHINFIDEKPSLIDVPEKKSNKKSKKKKEKIQINELSNDLQERIKNMKLLTYDKLFEWQIELGVDKDKLEKQKDLHSRKVGLARMQASNNIKKKLNIK